MACICLPNGNPAPVPKLDYKLKWFDGLSKRAKALLAHKVPVAIVGDFNVMPTELDVYKPEKYSEDALFRIEVKEAFHNLGSKAGPMPCVSSTPTRRSTPFGTYYRNAYRRNAGLRIDHFLLNPELAKQLKGAESTRK